MIPFLNLNTYSLSHLILCLCSPSGTQFQAPESMTWFFWSFLPLTKRKQKSASRVSLSEGIGGDMDGGQG